MTDQEIRKTLLAITEHLEEVLQYSAGIEAALVRQGKLNVGDVENCLADFPKHLSDVRTLISQIRA
jgi:hypothetical protein